MVHYRRVILLVFVIVNVQLFCASAGAFEQGDSSWSDGSDIRVLKHKKSKYLESEFVPLPPQPLMMAPPVVAAVPVEVQSVEIQEIRHEIDCPVGYDLVEGQCVTYDVIPGDMTCPPGSQMLDGQCVQFARGRRECSDGYRLSGSRCVATEIVPAELFCPNGELDESGTACRVFREIESRCAPGFVMTDGDCVQKFPAERTCPPGHKMHKDKCIQEIGVDANIICPSGAEMDPTGRRCFTMAPGKTKCPKGYKLSGVSGNCVKKMKKILAPCPPEFTQYAQHKGVCEKMVQIPPQWTCPIGSVLDPTTSQCILEAVGFAGVSCPPGFVQSAISPGMCDQIIDQVPVCPPDTMPVGFGPMVRCQSKIEHDIIECCPPGFEMIGDRCEREEIFAASTGCQGDCNRVRITAPIASCPMEYQLIGRHCVRHFPEPCPEPQVVIPTGCENYLESHSGSLRSSNHHYDQIPASCLEVVAAPIQPEACTAEDRMPPQMICPNGAELDGANCILREALAVEPVCRMGQWDEMTGRCIKKAVVPIKTECPAGTTRIGRHCVEYDEIPAQFVCPDGAMTDNSGSCVSRIPGAARTAEVTKTPAVPTCAIGRLQGTMCYEVERIPRQLVCPPGAIPAGNQLDDVAREEAGKYCMVVGDFVISPPVKKYIKPKYFCGDGTIAKGKHCHSRSNALAVPTCPPGTVLEGYICIRRMPVLAATQQYVPAGVAVPSCPPGTTVRGTSCIAESESPAHMICPPGYTPQAGRAGERECIKMVHAVAVCPAGARQTVDGCIVERFVAPTRRAVPVSVCETDLCP